MDHWYFEAYRKSTRLQRLSVFFSFQLLFSNHFYIYLSCLFQPVHDFPNLCHVPFLIVVPNRMNGGSDIHLILQFYCCSEKRPRIGQDFKNGSLELQHKIPGEFKITCYEVVPDVRTFLIPEIVKTTD